MNLIDYFNKIYTIAFRLTGDESKASDMAQDAVIRTFAGNIVSDKVSFSMLQNTAREVCKMFLYESENNNEIFRMYDDINNKSKSFQEALMMLNPLSRATIVWRDILGYKIEDMKEGNITKKELYSELNKARRLLKDKCIV